MPDVISPVGWVQELEKMLAVDRPRQSAREAGAISTLKQAIAQFGPGYGAGLEAKALASAKANLPRGIGGATSRPAAVSAGMSAEFEDMRRGKLAGALTNFANFMGSYRDPTAVTPSGVTHAVTGGFSGMLGQQRLDLQRGIAIDDANARIREENRLARGDAFGGRDWLTGSGDSGSSFGGSNLGLRPSTGGSIFNTPGTYGGGGGGGSGYSPPMAGFTGTASLGDFDYSGSPDPTTFSQEEIDAMVTRSGTIGPGQTAPATAALMSRYHRFQNQDETGGISYSDWYYNYRQ
jgi:hypothetical protein